MDIVIRGIVAKRDLRAFLTMRLQSFLSRLRELPILRGEEQFFRAASSLLDPRGGSPDAGGRVMPRALIVDDEPRSLAALAELIDREGFATASATTLAEAQTMVETESPDVVLTDLMLPD